MSTTKKWQKLTKINKIKNHQNQEKWKNRKSDKIRKSENSKNRKSENEKHEKCQKMVPPLKTPKCQINGTFWHFAFSEPPGWALFRFQGVPRDPILRPKSDPPYFWCFLMIFMISILCILTFFTFVHFNILVKIDILVKWHFCDMADMCNVIRPYSK